MAINEAGVMVNAELNMKDVKKELDIFFNTTVKRDYFPKVLTRECIYIIIFIKDN